MPWLSPCRDGATAGTCHDDSLDVCSTALQALRRLLAVGKKNRASRAKIPWLKIIVIHHSILPSILIDYLLLGIA